MSSWVSCLVRVYWVPLLDRIQREWHLKILGLSPIMPVPSSELSCLVCSHLHHTHQTIPPHQDLFSTRRSQGANSKFHYIQTIINSSTISTRTFPQEKRLYMWPPCSRMSSLRITPYPQHTLP
jgi:hypothetical protein